MKYFELKRSCSRIKCRVEQNFIDKIAVNLALLVGSNVLLM